MPLYLVRQTITEGDDQHVAERLVESPNKSGALKHVAHDTITVALAEHADVIRLTKDGINVEKAE